MTLSVASLVFSVGEPALAALRTRELPTFPGTIEPELRLRAQAVSGEHGETGRLHAIVEVDRTLRDLTKGSHVTLLSSIDSDLWIASLPVDNMLRSNALPGIGKAWAIRPLDRGERSQIDAAPRSAAGLLHLRVKCHADVNEGDARRKMESKGLDVTAWNSMFRSLEVWAEPAEVEDLLSMDAVRWVEPAPRGIEIANNGMRFDAQVVAPQALGYGGLGSVIGMWDSGAPDVLHPDLAGRVTLGESGLMTLFHPTHVAGTLLGSGVNSQAQGGGALQWRGVATLAEAVVYDATNAAAEVDSAIQLHEIDVSTNSWVYVVGPGNCASYGDYASDAPEFDALVRGLAGKAIPIVFAAGNERDDGDCGLDTTGGYWSLPPPATSKNLIAVGAHNSDLANMTVFSSWGPTDDGRMKPDLTAPGCQQGGDFGITSTVPTGLYAPLCGTSMAAPVVSGSIALLLEEWRSRFSQEPVPATYKALLAGFAKDRGPVGPDYKFGLGAIRLDLSLRELRSATVVEAQIDDQETDAHTFRVSSSLDTLLVTLAWDDPPGVEWADTSLVNDLDLVLESPTATIHLPLVLDRENPSALAVPGVNRLDNLEQVRVVSPPVGVWSARVTGTTVPEGPQTYSLVGFDLRSPADVAALFSAAVSDTSVDLNWTRPGDPDRAGTLLVRSTAPVAWFPQEGTSYPLGSEPSSGVFVVANDDSDHSVTTFTDSPLAPGTVYHYRAFAFDEIPNYSAGISVSATTTSNAVAVDFPDSAPAGEIRLTVAGANPIRGDATIVFEFPSETRFELSVFDARGARVETLRRGVLAAGTHRVVWSGGARGESRVPSGVYFVRLTTPERNLVSKVLVLR